MAKQEADQPEQVIREWPRFSIWLEEKQAHQGNLILTNEHLVYLKEKVLTEEEILAYNALLEKGAGTGEEIRFAVAMQKKNWSLPLSQVVRARLGIYQWLPFRLWLMLDYRSSTRKIRTHTFVFTMGRFKRMLLKEFPTLGWHYTINDELKHFRKRNGLPTRPD